MVLFSEGPATSIRDVIIMPAHQQRREDRETPQGPRNACAGHDGAWQFPSLSDPAEKKSSPR